MTARGFAPEIRQNDSALTYWSSTSPQNWTNESSFGEAL